MRFLLMLGLLMAGVMPAVAQGDIERQRQEGMQQFREAGVPNPATIRAAAEALFAKPVEQQNEEELRAIARTANAMRTTSTCSTPNTTDTGSTTSGTSS
jgi:hypothetical protein